MEKKKPRQQQCSQKDSVKQIKLNEKCLNIVSHKSNKATTLGVIFPEPAKSH